MALRGERSQSFLRSKELISFSEISHDSDGNNILKNRIIEEALARNKEGKFVRNKANIANILNRYGVIYRMVFNAMNMEQYTYTEVEEALKHLSNYINDLGISGIVEFHASDKTQNSDHIHFWINSEDLIIYKKIAKEMVSMGYSNIEDVYIQKYESNKKLDKSKYENQIDTPISERFPIQPIINKEDKNMKESITNKIENIKVNNRGISTIHQKYNLVIENIETLFNQREEIEDFKVEKSNSIYTNLILKECTLQKDDDTKSILNKIRNLREEIF